MDITPPPYVVGSYLRSNSKVYSQEHQGMIYCATSTCDGREVDHVFESDSDDEALEFAESQGWYFVEQETDIELVFIPDTRVLH